MGSHASHNMHANSIAAYHAEESRLSTRAQAVLAWIAEHGPHTDREVAAKMGFDHRSAVQPRISELLEAGKLLEVCSRRCPVTGKSVRVVDVSRPRRQQQEIPTGEPKDAAHS